MPEIATFSRHSAEKAVSAKALTVTGTSTEEGGLGRTESREVPRQVPGLASNRAVSRSKSRSAGREPVTAARQQLEAFRASPSPRGQGGQVESDCLESGQKGEEERNAARARLLACSAKARASLRPCLF